MESVGFQHLVVRVSPKKIGHRSQSSSQDSKAGNAERQSGFQKCSSLLDVDSYRHTGFILLFL